MPRRNVQLAAFFALVLLVAACRAPAPEPAPGPAPAPQWVVECIRLEYATSGNLATELQSLASGQEGLRVASDERTNSILLSGTHDQVAVLKDLIATLDVEVGS